MWPFSKSKNPHKTPETVESHEADEHEDAAIQNESKKRRTKLLQEIQESKQEKAPREKMEGVIIPENAEKMSMQNFSREFLAANKYEELDKKAREDLINNMAVVTMELFDSPVLREGHDSNVAGEEKA